MQFSNFQAKNNPRQVVMVLKYHKEILEYLTASSLFIYFSLFFTERTKEL